RSAHVDEAHAFFNGTSVFLAVHGQEHLPCHLLLQAPQVAPHWTVHTSLPEASGQPEGADRHGFGMDLAPDYDALIDHPVEMGTPQVVSFEACGAHHEMVFTGVVPNLDLERIADDTRRICEAQIAFFEPETRAVPFLDSSDRYVFMTLVTGDGYGADKQLGQSVGQLGERARNRVYDRLLHRRIVTASPVQRYGLTWEKGRLCHETWCRAPMGLCGVH